MSQATRPTTTAEQQHAQAVQARKRILIRENSAAIFVRAKINGEFQTIALNKLPPVERAKAIQDLLKVDNLQLPTGGTTTTTASSAPAPIAPAPPTVTANPPELKTVKKPLKKGSVSKAKTPTKAAKKK